MYKSPGPIRDTSAIRMPERLRPPLSPRVPTRPYSEAQLKLFEYQREMMKIAGATGTAPKGAVPSAPALAPAGSPGPTTPLMLDDQMDYLTAGASRLATSIIANPMEMVQRMIRENTEHSGPCSPPISPRSTRA